MIRMIQSISAGHAKAYFTDALAKSDYYVDDQELQGRFYGRLADRLGLLGEASKEAFFALCENKNPVTGKQLTPRMKDKRIVGYDINFHCPKSVSILHALAKDDHIRLAFEEAVLHTMLDIEAEAKTRVRKNDVYEDRRTGELIWADFVHQTARPVEGHSPDPHLHSHCFVFNATWDEQEKIIKAGKFRDIKRDMPYYQACFQKRLADQMVQMGYRVKRTQKSFEIEGVPQAVIGYFSKRTNEIGKIAKEKNITDAKQLDALGARTRARKQKGLSMQELKKEWRERMKTLSQQIDDKPIRFPREKEETEKTTQQQCIDYALQHCFERASVMSENRLLEAACGYALGHTNISVQDLQLLLRQDDRIIRVPQGERFLCTTREVLLEEKRMVELARKGIGKMPALYLMPPIIDKKFDEHQRAAIHHVVTTTNQVSIIRGAAGAGKTNLMPEAIRLMKDANKRVTVVAPTASAARDTLRKEGFKEAETVAKLLIDSKMQERLDGQVLWVDEAGLLGTKDMVALLDLVTKKNARLILGGDTRQHASVVRGDALRILNTVGGIQTAEVSIIHRQKNSEYKKAVECLTNGNIADGFKILDDMQAIHEIDPMNPNEELVRDYFFSVSAGKSALVIAPTHEQGNQVTDDIRDMFRAHGKLGKKEVEALRYINLNFTEAEKSDWRKYSKGQVIQFNQNLRKIKRGSVWSVSAIDKRKIYITQGEDKKILPLDKAKQFEVFEKSQIGLSKGDKVRITKGGFDKTKKRLENGTLLDVTGVRKSGRILLRNKTSKTNYILDTMFGHIAHAHCVTSHASQGKTVDEVFVSQPAATFGATNAKQFYVSVSRGRDDVHIYTDDREALLEHIQEIGDRASAIELTRKRIYGTSPVIDRQRRNYRKAKSKRQTFERNFTEITKDHEPKP